MADDPTIAHNAFKEFDRNRFSLVAEGYDQAIAVVTSQANEAILDAVGAKSGLRLLDVACGTGWLSAAAVKREAIVTGLDFAENMVAIARVRCPKAQFYNGDAENLTFESSQFEAVVCSLGILHFQNPERALAESFRVLKPGGRYAFTCWTPPTRNPFMALILGSVQTYGSTDVDLLPAPPLFRFGDPTECAHVLNGAGFTEVSVTELPIRDFQRINYSKKNKRQVLSRMIIILRGEKRGCPGQPLFSPSSMHEESIHLSSALKLNSVN
ncbi:class I SAM-dependent methyltransferase [Nostoc sp. 'Peltigera membranacea cyanobiont' 232]|uniref:class I SAM-dependent methyltransferase n=1 Tax=Nostoc sp. 'Peltigera membranacea cyanobiont' 232 TaxID=2014531 RepID=UPI000B95BEA6|nr:methyltransferase domain-containing protein [Nostoc sp. 'Peltigera membranacea cyanobiont' 232]OYD99211.1 hypothetical protein CDG79_39755 [Nostoc sp. 'Peltigera membranacea cyanobiont' 232]